MNKLHDLRGEQKDQLLILCDKQGNPIGEATREECHRGKGKTHLAFMAFVVDNYGKVVLTRRSSKKSLWAGFWDASVVSHVLAGEMPLTSANRRGKEELGVDVSFELLGGFYYFAPHGKRAENEYCYVLIGTTEQDMMPNPIEINDVLTMTFKILRKKIKEGKSSFSPWLHLAFEKIGALTHL